MLMFNERILYELLIVVIFIISVIYFYFKYSFTFWKKMGILYIKPQFPYGNCYESIQSNRPFGIELAEFYNYFKSKGHKYGGIYFFSSPALVAVCPDFIKSVLAKDFTHFVDRGFYHDEENDPLSAHLFALDGQKWRNLRGKLSPTFTSGKLKKMFQTLVDCSLELRDCLNEPISKNEPVDIKQILIQYTTDVIGSCAFGIECNSFKNSNTEFITISTKIFNIDRAEKLKFFLAFIVPKVAKLLKVRLTNKDVDIFYRNLIKETVEYREENNIIRNDFMHLLIQLKNKGYLEDEENKSQDKQIEKTTTNLTMNELSAQAFLFFAAGFETSSTAMNWCLFELSQHSDIQNKLREDIIRVMKQYDGKITYDALSKMYYLDMVIKESMRKYPPFLFIQRIVTQDYVLPDENKVLKKGTRVFIPVYGLHTDPEFYPNPDKFAPERFTEENKGTRPDYSWLPFGEGPRICIGLRFAMMQMKVGLCQLLVNYKFTLHPKTKLPIVLDPLSVVCSAKDKIWLNAEKIVD